MSIYIYNTLTRKKQEFVPLVPGHVKMYVCGPTVYDYCHLGHGRAYVAFDIVYRYFKYKGYNVTYVRNITDIDDKIIKRANEMDLPGAGLKEKVSILTRKYIDEFRSDMKSLNMLPPTYEPKATEYITNMIELIEKLIKEGLAYTIGGNVYYEVGKFIEYGKLSGRSLDELLSGARVEPLPEKKAPLDFSLWKEAKPNEPYWDSPWGKGRPGWHIECSSMSLGLLGEEFDIHGGGQDLIFPHHENEIAQSYGCSGKQPARYWIHNGFVIINKEKMSKSLGNFFTLREIFQKYKPEIVRFFLLSQHYRSPIDFSDQLLEDAKSAMERIEDCFRRACIYTENKSFEIKKSIYGKHKEKFQDAMDDDFNTAKALAVIFDVIKDINNGLNKREEKEKVYARLKALSDFLDVLGIRYTLADTITVKKENEKELNETALQKIFSRELSRDTLIELLKARNYYRGSKQWELADKVRRYLVDKGYIIRDSSKETVLIAEKIYER